MLRSNKHVMAKRMRWAARIIGLGAAGFLLIMLIGGALTEGLGRDIAGAIVSWWREHLAAILLVSTSIGIGIHIGFFAGRNHLLAWAIVGLPYLIAGILLLNSWRLSRQVQ